MENVLRRDRRRIRITRTELENLREERQITVDKTVLENIKERDGKYVYLFRTVLESKARNLSSLEKILQITKYLK